MEIKLTEKYSLVSQEHGYDLVEKVTRHKIKEGTRGKNAEKTGETYEAVNTIAYNVTIEYAIEKVCHLNLHDKLKEVDLKQFIVELKKEREELSKLINSVN